MTSPSLSAIVCTHNRAHSLHLSLGSLLQQDVEPTTLEIIVVDNASTDATREVVVAFAERSAFQVHYAEEARLGLSHARNTGAERASAPLIAWLDDDAEVVPWWARAHLRAFEDPSCIATGGRTILAWPGQRPRWLPGDLDGYFSFLDRGDHDATLTMPDYPVGANFALRRTTFDASGGFDPRLGRQGTRLISNEEKALFQAVAGLPGRVRYVADALAHHHVPPDRARVSWIVRRVFSQGTSNEILAGGRGGSVAGAARQLLVARKRELPRAVIDHGWSALVGELTSMAYWAGRLTERVRARRSRS